MKRPGRLRFASLAGAPDRFIGLIVEIEIFAVVVLAIEVDVRSGAAEDAERGVRGAG